MPDISIEKRKQILQEAQEILKKFSKALEGVNIKKENLERNEKSSGFREEGPGREGDQDFRKRMFANAPKHTADTIVAERKSW